MELKLYRLLSTRSKTAMLKQTDSKGHRYDYEPRERLLTRLAQQTGMSRKTVYARLMQERRYLMQLSETLEHSPDGVEGVKSPCER